MYRNERCLVTAPLPRAAWTRDVKLEFALCDRQVLLAVDGQTVVCEPYEATTVATGGNPCAARDDGVGRGSVRLTSGEAELVRSQGQAVEIAASGMSLDLHRLQVFRDLHYLDPQGLGRDWIAPAKLGPDEVLVLGDNVPVSRDSRHSPQAAVPRTRWLGRVVTLP